MKKNKRCGLRRALAAAVFCTVLGAGTVCSAEEGKVVAAGAYIRAAADASSAQLASIKQGDKVDVISKTVGSDGKNWYQVWINGAEKGFIRADLVEVKDDGSIATLKNDDANAANTTSAADTSVTSTDARRATVSTNGTRIRKGASTNDDVIATANRGMVLTVTGEANGADGKVWYQVTFTYNDREITGFIRSDLVTFDEVAPDEAVSNITGTEEGGEQTETPPEEQPQETEPAEDTQQPAAATQVVQFLNTDEKPYIMPGFVLVDIKVSEDEKVKAWKYNDYVICYADVNGSQGWYLIENFSDPQNCVVQKYAYADITENPDGSSGNILPMVVLAVIIVILLAVIGVMFLKLRDYSGGYEDDDDDDDDYYGNEDDELEDEDEEPAPQPIRRPQPSRQAPQPQGQSQRRPMPQQQGQPQRRPMPQQQGQPQRRPAPQQQGQPQRRPQQPVSDGEMRRRPEGDGRVVTRPNSQRPSGGQTSQRKTTQGQTQRGKSKNNSNNGQNDMDFIDI